MQEITMTGRHFDVTEPLKQFTREKFSRLERHFDRISGVNVIFGIEKLSQVAEATILVSGAKIHASAESADMYSSIDELVDKLDRKLKKHKEKIKDHRE